MKYISLNNISKRFNDGTGGQRTVLDGLCLDVEKGDHIAITGVSGTGKTTLLRILGTLTAPDEGTYLLDGESVNYADDRQLRQLRNGCIGFVFQDCPLLPWLTAWQNILLPAQAASGNGRGAKLNPSSDTMQWAEELVRLMDIGHVREQMPQSLSGGERCRVGLCRALVMRPSLLLADEPTGQLDAEHAHEVAELLTMVNEQLGMTVVTVTHSDSLAQTARRVYRLDNGKLIMIDE